MTTYAGIAGAAALTLTLGLATPATSSGPSPLAWSACGPAGLGQECATLRVPLDYADPRGPQVDLAVSRIRASGSATWPGARRGTLLVVAGGPGSSGVQRLSAKGAALKEQLGGAYDLVSFDPRGVGGSVKARCGLDAADRHLVTLRGWPAADGSIDENVARSRRVAEACARNGGAVLRSLTTPNQVRDMDRLRQALGERRISAWANSYGTYVTAQYAQEFPRRTDRIVLDSSADPNPATVAQGWLRDMARGADDRFPDFAAWAAHPDRAASRLADRPEDVRPLVLDLAARLDRAPKPSTTPGVPLTGNLLRQALQSALYSDAAFADFARLVKQAADPAAVPVLPPVLAGPMPDEDATVTVGVVCNDVRWRGTLPTFRRGVAADRAAHPLTAGMPVNITPCSFWKDTPAEPPTRLTSDGPSDVLMIQGLRDPSTPHSSALEMRAALGARARLVSVDRGGHGMYLSNGNPCGDRTVTRFLLTGERPASDVTCR
ncbi:alpha/beta hydrolase [Streptomyces roseicoloratus]|uniref:Alpha/beta hydrolase n=1 Tax=Streptomyces roseicoloratus TaxID=2508722 RepID=A0ABY9RUZ0_9ACTN|nr:alpha/beta hydrolase [Streptomyces roseicoloratus]WMX45800.1 alpha/beta hydrolase [Streptomyces roseicoloratus]